MSTVSEFNQENGKSEQSVYQIGILSVHFRWIFVRFLGPEKLYEFTLHQKSGAWDFMAWPASGGEILFNFNSFRDTFT